MKEVLLNGYLKIQPLETDGFVSDIKTSYEEIGTVIARDEVECAHIPLGSKVYFDSFMGKKYPIKGEIDKFQWFVHHAEVVKYDADS